MRSARSSVEEAPSKSPWDIRVLAWVTSERVAAERLFSRGGGAGACCDGDVGEGGASRGELVTGGAGDGGLGEGVPGADGRGENSEQPDSSAVIASARSTFSMETVCAETWLTRVSE